ncbi:nucleoside hydrolase [Rhizohabitans arisaemae]|uniref:nucleoside hydrolase n=1 Tax=Rhizohabitans arisaemae TaxID=2720610 RepID=UPI0024B061E6|nr:nucleoside hydrolase [Rhizohabitans arisaemae]
MKLIVDSDGGIDDAVALWWLCGRSDVDVVAVTAVGGSVPVHDAGRNLRVILEAAGRPDIPVHVGLDPTGPAPPTRRPVLIHGHDGLGDLGPRVPVEPALTAPTGPEVIAREVSAGTSLLTLGPLTNVAAAVRSSAGTAKARLTLMGGSARAGGNARPGAEANIAHDPSAAAAVLAADWAAPPLMIGLDVTHTATLTDDELGLLRRRLTPAADFLDGPLAVYRRFGAGLCPPGQTPCHDLLAAMACVDPTLVTAEVLPVAVDTGGSAAWGQTVVDMRPLARRRSGGATLPDDGNAAADGSPVAVALDADVSRFRRLVRELFAGSHLLQIS